MLSPDYLAHIPDAACALWQQVEEDILADIARRLAKMGEVTDTALWQVKRLEQIRLFRSDVVRRLKKASGQSEALIRQLLQLACTQALQADDVAHEAAGQTVSAMNDSIALRNLLTAGAKQTNGTMANITATTANTATRQFERALDRAWLQTTSGAFDYKTAVRRCVADLASTGLEAVRYPSGHVDTLEVAVRRAVVTGVNQSACRLQVERCKEVGCDLVEVTAHVGARPSHAQWQGKIYSISGKHSKYPPLSETGYGTGAGLGGWNCRHNMFPFWEGISEPQYTPQRLAELDAKNIEYKGKQYSRYEINQMQRSRERRVRRWKRQYAMEEAAGLDSTQTAVWLKKARVDLEHFTRDTGGRVDSARVGVHGFGRSQAIKATNSAIRQHSAWMKSIGAENSELSSLAKYYEEKYNESPDYQLFARYSRSVQNGMISPLAGFDNYVKSYRRIQSELVGKETVNDIRITGQSIHFMERVLGTKEDPKNKRPRSGVEVDEIVACVTAGKLRRVKKDSEGRMSQLFYSESCAVSINPESGILVQCNPL